MNAPHLDQEILGRPAFLWVTTTAHTVKETCEQVTGIPGSKGLMQRPGSVPAAQPPIPAVTEGDRCELALSY